MKFCSRCGDSKSLDSFSPHRGGSQSRYAYCRPCAAQYARERATPESKRRDVERQRLRRADPGKVALDRKTAEAWRLANPVKSRARNSTPEKIESNKRWRAANRDRDIAATRRYQAEHPEVGAVSQQRRRARKFTAESRLTAAEWRQIVQDFGEACAYCLRADLPLQQEHMTPLCRGGHHTLDNIVPACGPCNYRKHTRDLLGFLLVGGKA